MVTARDIMEEHKMEMRMHVNSRAVKVSFVSWKKKKKRTVMLE